MTEAMVDILPHHTKTERAWVIRDDNQQAFFGDIPENQEVVSMKLSWKLDTVGSEVFIGCFRLHLASLVEEGYTKLSGRGRHLRFQREDNLIQISCGRTSLALTIGSLPRHLLPK